MKPPPLDIRAERAPPKFARGDHVHKITGYPFPGVVVAAYDTLAGQPRVVVECTVPEVVGMQHIFNPDQLEHD